MKHQVKICGITSVADAKNAADCGADFIGSVVDIAYSPRSISVEAAAIIIARSSVPAVLLFEKPCGEIKRILPDKRPYGIQLVGDCTADEIQGLKRDTGCAIWKTVHLPKDHGAETDFDALLTTVRHYTDAGVDRVILDTLVKHKKGGTGEMCDWDFARRLVGRCPVPVFLAGGITPANVRDAVTRVKPQGIDVSSGVEALPGKKDPVKMDLLVNIIRSLEK